MGAGPVDADPPWDTMGYGQQTDSTYPTGMHSCYIYRPQRSWAKVMFLQASVCPRGGGEGCLPQCMLGYPPGADTTTPGPGTSPDQAPPWSRPPQEQTPPLDQAPPPPYRPGTPPPGKQTAAYG